MADSAGEAWPPKYLGQENTRNALSNTKHDLLWVLLGLDQSFLEVTRIGQKGSAEGRLGVQLRLLEPSLAIASHYFFWSGVVRRASGCSSMMSQREK